MHPDKLRQRGQVVSADAAAQFGRVKDAHAVLSDPRLKRTYDRYGANGVTWVEDPATIDPNVRNHLHAHSGNHAGTTLEATFEILPPSNRRFSHFSFFRARPQAVLHNFTHSTTQDRCRVVSTFAALAAALLLFPVLLCEKLDAEVKSGWAGQGLPWSAVFAPLLLLEAAWLVLQGAALLALRRANAAASVAAARAPAGGPASGPAGGSGAAGSYGVRERLRETAWANAAALLCAPRYTTRLPARAF